MNSIYQYSGCFDVTGWKALEDKNPWSVVEELDANPALLIE
jgi:hypothetical protein